MKKLLIICLGLFVFSCTPDRGVNENDHATSNENVDIGSGEEINPQLEADNDSARLEVDTVSSPAEINQEQKEDEL